jgi:hypothetical protein
MKQAKGAAKDRRSAAPTPARAATAPAAAPPALDDSPLSVTQISAIVGVSGAYVRKSMRAGTLKCTQVNTHLRTSSIEQVEEWLHDLRRTPIIPPREYLRRTKEAST